MGHPPSIYDFLAGAIPPALQALAAATLLVLLLGLYVRSSLAGTDGVIPDDRLTLRNALEILLEGIISLARDVMGEKWATYLPLVGTIGIFILIANLMGLVPGVGGPTSYIETNLGWALIAFIVAEIVGIKEHGFGYVKHFMPGPSWIAFMTMPIEILSHLIRVMSLTIRLTANMFADHTLLAIFISLPIFGVFTPWVIMTLGTFVSFVQAFIFAFLTMIYIGQSLDHAH